MKKFLLSTLAAFFVSTSYAEEVVGDPPIDEVEEIVKAETLEQYLNQSWREHALSHNYNTNIGDIDKEYPGFDDLTNQYNTIGQIIIAEVTRNKPYCQYDDRANNSKPVYEYSNYEIKLFCSDNYQTLFTRLNELEMKKSDWKPKYTFSKYKRMTLLDLAEVLIHAENLKGKEYFDYQNISIDLEHFLGQEYGQVGVRLAEVIAGAAQRCSGAKKSGEINYKDMKKLCNMTVKDVIDLEFN